MSRGTKVNFQGVRENSNVQVAFDYEELTALAPTDAVTKSVALPWPYTKLWIFSDNELYWTWALTDADTDAIDTDNSQKLPAGVPIQMDVPWGRALHGRADTIYWQCRRVSSGTADVRVSRG